MKPKLSGLRELKKFLRGAGFVVALDLETCPLMPVWDGGGGRPPGGYDAMRKLEALSPFHGRIRAISLAAADGRCCFVDAFPSAGTSQDAWDAALRDALAPLQRRCVLSHNALFDATWLAAVYGLRFKRLNCTLTLSRLLTNGDLQAKNDLGAVLERELGVKVCKGLGATDWSGPLTGERLRYMANDVRHLHRLETRLQSRIDDAGLRDTANLELSLLPVVVDLHCAGIRVVADRLARLTKDGENHARKAEAEIRKRVGCPDLNVGSPIQLRAVLGLPATNKETLMAIEEADPNKMLASRILAWREARKLTSTFTKQ